MQLTYLGHAGFCLETPDVTVIMDPWLSPEGAFDSAWFQFPRNHHLAKFVYDKLSDATKQRFVYVSHEHHDHFDPRFLSQIPTRDFTFVIPKFERPALRVALTDFQAKSLVPCSHGQAVPIPGGLLKIYMDDSGLSRDSGVFVRVGDESFLNLNDCKLYDELPAILANDGPISVFSCQFSGATWHPTCYDYPRAEYERISHHKITSKFEMIARAIEVTKARVYLPSAGPACFLDPALMHLNFEPVNIFPRAAKFLSYLDKRLADSPTKAFEISPGDSIDVASGGFLQRNSQHITEETLPQYLAEYAKDYEVFFQEQHRHYSPEETEELLTRLRTQLQRKLDAFTLHEKVRVPLYFRLSDHTASILRIAFPQKSVDIVHVIPETDYYSISAPAWQVARILDGHITWEDFALTFRMRLDRQPDVYQTMIQGFLLMEPEDMNFFCAKLVGIEETQKRAVVEAGGTRYSIDRYCPHQGADLTQGWLSEGRLWTCPRHRWQFALDKDGRCLTSNSSIHAVCLEGE